MNISLATVLRWYGFCCMLWTFIWGTNVSFSNLWSNGQSLPTVFRNLPCNACGFSILWRTFSSSSCDMVLLFSIHSCLEFLVSFGFCFFFFRPLMEIRSLAVVRKIRLWSVYNGSNRPLNSIPHDIFLSFFVFKSSSLFSSMGIKAMPIYI